MNARDNDDLTPLHAVVKDGYPETAQFLIDRGADVHVKDKNGRTPLDYARGLAETTPVRARIKSVMIRLLTEKANR